MASLPKLDLATVAARQTLEDAWRRVQAKASGGGIDGQTVADFGRDRQANLARLRRELLQQRYVPEPTREIRIPKDGAPSERRPIGLASVRDKIVQEAVRSVLEPHAERRFLGCSYGYRPGRGPVRAIARVTHHVRHLKHRWVVTADVDDCFGSLTHALLVDNLRSLGASEPIVRLVSLWLQMGVVDGRARWRDVRSGVSQGAVVSPLLANLYLHAFDRAMVSREHALIRYADDFVITAAERPAAERAFADARACLDDLGLRLNEHPAPVAAVADGFAFLGIVFTDRGRTIHPRKLDGVRGRLGRVGTFKGGLGPAVERTGEVVVGLRRYYGAVLEPADLAPLDDVLREALASLVGRAAAAGALRSRRAAQRALRDVGTVAERSETERRRWIEELVNAAMPSAAPSPARRGEPADAAGPEASPAADAEPRAEPADAARIVRRRKQRYHREQAARRELVVDTPGSWVGKTGGRLVVRRQRRRVADVPLLQLAAVTVAAHGISLSSDVVALCADRGIPLHVVSGDGRPAATLSAPWEASGDTALLQIRALDGETVAIELARRFVDGKIRNQLSVVKRLRKSRRDDGALAQCIETATAVRAELDAKRIGSDLQVARGRLFSIEGRAAQIYWSAIRAVTPQEVGFPGRRRQGATDLMNCLLNYGYGVLQRIVHLAILKAGLNPAISFLHSLQRRTPTLVFDLMEEFRAPVVDRAVVTLLNRREPAALDDDGRLDRKTRRRLLQRVHERLNALVQSGGADATLEQIVARQARALVRHLEGRRRYRPFLDRW